MTTETETALTWTDEGVIVHRLPWMTQQQWVTVRDAMVAYFAEAGLIRTGPTCPWWCTRADAVHLRGESEAGGGEVLHVHARGYGDDAMAVVQYEDVKDGVTTWRKPEIAIYEMGEPENVAEARMVAGWFTAAADLLEQITADGTTQ